MKRGQKKINTKIDAQGCYGQFGGQYAPEVLLPALEELGTCFNQARKDKKFLHELGELYKNFVGRPSPLYFCKRLSQTLGGARIFLKNEGSNHTGAHKINHCVGQALLAKRMNKSRIIAETGAGQHGLATAAVCAQFGFRCVVYMGAVDVERQRPNVFWMEQLGATVVPVQFGQRRLKDAVNAALKDWISNVKDTHYLLGSAVGPHPFPEINRYFQAIVGKEIRQQMLEQTGQLPDYVIACVGGGSNAIGAFDTFLNEPTVTLIGVEAGGSNGKHARRLSMAKGKRRIGVVEGFKSYWLQTAEGQLAPTHSISAGLDYAGVGPIHAYLRDTQRVTYCSAKDSDVLKAFSVLAKQEGILPALESAHAVSEALRLAPKLSKKQTIVVNLSGRGEKDMFILARHLGDNKFKDFLKAYLKTL